MLTSPVIAIGTIVLGAIGAGVVWYAVTDEPEIVHGKTLVIDRIASTTETPTRLGATELEGLPPDVAQAFRDAASNGRGTIDLGEEQWRAVAEEFERLALEQGSTYGTFELEGVLLVASTISP